MGTPAATPDNAALTPDTRDSRVGRIRFMDAQRVNLDGFAHEAPALGLVALHRPNDPIASLVIAGGRIVEMDSRAVADFDSLDAMIATHGIVLAVAEESMSMSDVALARLFVDPAVPRAEVIRLASGAHLRHGDAELDRPQHRHNLR